MRAIALLPFVFLMLTAVGRAELIRPTVGQDALHTVAEGEDLYTIAHGAGLGLEHVSFANRLPMKLELTPGQQLVLPTRRVMPANPPANGMVLNVPERGIFLFRDGRFVKFYPVAIGRPDFPTPRGNFRVIEKVKDPTWVPPAWAKLEVRSIGPGPDNPLGDRWIGLSATRVGIHGTQSPYSIGDAISHGCLRMYPEQVRELYERVHVGMPIRIEYETAKLGRDPATGALLLVTFPDPYGLSNPQASARKLLRQAGVSAPSLRDVHGVAYDPSASPVAVRLNDQALELSVPPILDGGRLFLSRETLKTLGIAEEPAGVPTVRRGDQVYFAARPVLERFGVDYRFASSTRTLFLHHEELAEQGI